MNKYKNQIVDWLIQKSIIVEADRTLYEYAVCNLFLLFIPIILAGGIGLGFGSIENGLTVAFPFMVLRKFSGGYHAPKLSICIVGSSALLFWSIWRASKATYDWNMVFMTFLASISLIIFSPIDNENKKLEDEEKRIYKKITVGLVMVLVGIGIIMNYLGKSELAVCFSVGIQLSAVLQIPCIVQRICNLPKKAEKCRLVHKGLK